jgi:hypothetical protein
MNSDACRRDIIPTTAPATGMENQGPTAAVTGAYCLHQGAVRVTSTPCP